MSVEDTCLEIDTQSTRIGQMCTTVTDVDTDPPRVVGTHQIRLMLGVSRSRAAQLVSQKGFPDPFARLGKAHIWLADDVDAWAERTGRELHPLEEDQ